MTLPLLNAAGDLPPGIHAATMRELTTRFGGPSRRRAEVARRLLHVYRLARETRNLGRFIVFGSYITAKAAPNDVDVVLVMDDRFQLEACPVEARVLFDHAAAQAELGASVFWIRPAMLLEGDVDSFISYWQRKRDGGLRGIVEVTT